MGETNGKMSQNEPLGFFFEDLLTKNRGFLQNIVKNCEFLKTFFTNLRKNKLGFFKNFFNEYFQTNYPGISRNIFKNYLNWIILNKGQNIDSSGFLRNIFQESRYQKIGLYFKIFPLFVD